MSIRFLTYAWVKAVENALNADPVFTAHIGTVRVRIQQVVDTPAGQRKYWLIIGDGRVRMGVGDLGKEVDVVIQQDFDTAVALSKNELTSTASFMSGKLRVSGDLMKLFLLQGPLGPISEPLKSLDVDYSPPSETPTSKTAEPANGGGSADGNAGEGDYEQDEEPGDGDSENGGEDGGGESANGDGDGDKPHAREVLGPPSSEEPPSSFWPLLKSDGVVVAQGEFEFTVGIAASPEAGVSGGPISKPDFIHGAYDISVQLSASGFSPRPDEKLVLTLPVKAKTPYPSVSIHLTPDAQDADTVLRGVRAQYSVGGRVLGIATKAMIVARTQEIAGRTKEPETPPPFQMEPLGAVPADLTITILAKHGGAPGDLEWSFQSTHPEVRLPEQSVDRSMPDPKEFAQKLMDSVKYQEDEDPGNLYANVKGLGLDVQDAMPPVVWSLLKQAAAYSEGPPVVYILSEEPYVPWEIAATVDVLDQPLVAGAPPFLGAQAVVSRWVHREVPPDDMHPEVRTVQPPAEVAVKAMTVIRGLYGNGDSEWSRLEQAEAEATALHERFAATVIDAESGAVRDCLKDAKPPATLVHFAVHGKWDTGTVRQGIVLMGAKYLNDSVLKGYIPLAQHPFVFLNACQVGQGDLALGQYSGIAAALLRAGASGVVAPIWSVDDEVAKDLALRFYHAVSQGSSPAEFLRQERATFAEAAGPTSATQIAYLFYGHPSLKLSGLKEVKP